VSEEQPAIPQRAAKLVRVLVCVKLWENSSDTLGEILIDEDATKKIAPKF